MDNAKLQQRLMAILAADVAGYSRLMAADEHATIAALDAARQVFRQNINHHRGRIVDTAGDSVLAVFDSASRAVDAALAIQQQLEVTSFVACEDRRMQFRIGIHLGDVIAKPDGSIYGTGVNIAARLQALSVPGDIWVSAAVHSALGDRIGRNFDDQGLHQVRNIDEPVHAYRVSTARTERGLARSQAPKGGIAIDNGVPASVPIDSTIPTKSPVVRSAISNNLPLNLTELIGRGAERAAVTELLLGTHLLTLVGAGGIGKTRLALDVASAVQNAFKDGVWFVELAPVSEPALVTRTVASVVDVHEEPGRPLQETLLDFLRHRELLIVLDNCEHLVGACAQLAENVLHSSGGARVLATSREALGIDGEVAWRVPSLIAAAPDEVSSAQQLMDYAATQLFVQRAQAASSTFRLTSDNATAVASICHQLDGIPLALELAAARVKSMRVEQVADRLRDRFALLTRGSRTALQRHQTLRSLIDWSHDLLSESECVLLRRLSVFAGGWTLEAAENICCAGTVTPERVLDLLSHLVEKSLVLLDDQSATPRYRVLETIGQYGLEKLISADEADAVRERHLMYFVGVAEIIRTELHGRDGLRCLDLLEVELDNLRVAMTFSLKPGRSELGLRLLSALQYFWYSRMHWKELVDWVDRLAPCSAADGPPSLHRARALYVGAIMAHYFDPLRARRLCEECLEISRSLDFHEGMAWALMWLGYFDTRKRDPGTADLFAESLGHGRQIQDPWRSAMLITQCLTCYAGYEALMGRYDSAAARVAECEIEVARIGNDGLYVGHCRALQGTMAVRRGDFESAGRLLDESLALYRTAGSKFDIGGSLAQHGFLALSQGNPMLALQRYKEGLELHRNYPMSPWVTKGLAHLLIAYAACERWQIAARLTGALRSAESASAAVPSDLSGRVARAYEEAVARTKSNLGASVFNEEADAGRRMTREKAIELALGE
jgi:predicted ATPase/class 3 adenylate cyclase